MALEAAEAVENRPRRKKGEGLKVSFAARWSEEDLQEIRARADAQGLPTSEYVRRCALGLHASDSEIAERFAALENRLELLEQRAEASGW